MCTTGLQKTTASHADVDHTHHFGHGTECSCSEISRALLVLPLVGSAARAVFARTAGAVFRYTVSGLCCSCISSACLPHPNRHEPPPRGLGLQHDSRQVWCMRPSQERAQQQCLSSSKMRLIEGVVWHAAWHDSRHFCLWLQPLPPSASETVLASRLHVVHKAPHKSL